MQPFQWSDQEYSVGVKSMDEQHHYLMDLVNKIYKASDAKPNKEANKILFDDVVAFTVKHFSEEEALMEMEKYPDLERHKKIHQDLVEKVNIHYKKFKEGNGSFTPEFLMFLKVWLSAHIKGIDTKYGKHILGKKTA